MFLPEKLVGGFLNFIKFSCHSVVVVKCLSSKIIKSYIVSENKRPSILTILSPSIDGRVCWLAPGIIIISEYKSNQMI